MQEDENKLNLHPNLEEPSPYELPFKYTMQKSEDSLSEHWIT